MRDGRGLWSGRNPDQRESRLVRLRSRASHRQGRTRPRCIPNRYGFLRLPLRLQLRTWLRRLHPLRRRMFRVRHRRLVLRRHRQHQGSQCRRRTVNLLVVRSAGRSKAPRRRNSFSCFALQELVCCWSADTAVATRIQEIRSQARVPAFHRYGFSPLNTAAIVSRSTASARTSGRTPACCRPALICFSG